MQPKRRAAVGVTATSPQELENLARKNPERFAVWYSQTTGTPQPKARARFSTLEACLRFIDGIRERTAWNPAMMELPAGERAGLIIEAARTQPLTEAPPPKPQQAPLFRPVAGAELPAVEPEPEPEAPPPKRKRRRRGRAALERRFSRAKPIPERVRAMMESEAKRDNVDLYLIACLWYWHAPPGEYPTNPRTGEPGRFWIGTLAGLAKATGINRRTLRRRMRALDHRGACFIRRVQRGRPFFRTEDWQPAKRGQRRGGRPPWAQPGQAIQDGPRPSVYELARTPEQVTAWRIARATGDLDHAPD